MNSVSPIVSEDAARRWRRCKRINAADRWHCGEYNPLMRLQSDRLLPVPMAATRDGRYRSVGGGNERPPLICELPLTPSCRSSDAGFYLTRSWPKG
jgi:hypothetical protein